MKQHIKIQEPINPEARKAFDKAIEASIRGDLQAAIAEFSRAIEAEPTCALLHFHIAGCHFGKGRVQESLSALSEAIRLEPRFAAAYLLREECYDRLGDGVKAMADRRMGLALPEPRFLDYPARFVVSLYSEPFVREARKIGVNVEDLLDRIADMPDARVLKYPDGTIQLEGEGTTSIFETVAGSRVRERAIQLAHAEDPLHMRSLLGGTGFASLHPFPARIFYVLLWGEFVKENEGGLGVRPGINPQPVDGKVNGPIENLPVTVAIRRRFSKQTRQQLAELVSSYLACVRTEGLFGEGPIARASEAIDFFPRVAQFRIDASRSGQNTINWLILSLVGFSSVNLVTEIHFTEQLNAEWTLERYFGLSSEKLVKVTIPEVSSAVPTDRGTVASAGRTELGVLGIEDEVQVGAADEGEAVNHAIQPYEGVSSDHFPILRTPLCVPDDLAVTVFFEELPKAGERQPFANSIRSWLNLGQLGAFGAPGFGYVGEVEYDTDNDSLYFFCDLGATDMNLAIRILVNTLEGWHTHGIVIKSLVLGKEQPVSWSTESIQPE